MSKLFWISLLFLFSIDVSAQQRKFVLTKGAQFIPGKARVKLKASYKSEFISNPVSKASGLFVNSVKPVVLPLLAKKGASWRGPLATPSKIDIALYYEVKFNQTQDLESTVNQLY